MKRFDSKAILGVSLNKGMSLHDLTSKLTIGCENLAILSPTMYDKISPFLNVMETLTSLQENVQEQGRLIVDFQQQIVEGEKNLNQAMIAYEQHTKTILDVIGVTGGIQPPYPAVAGITSPLIAAINSATSILDKLKDQLQKKLILVGTLSTQLKTETEQAVADINNTLAEEFAVDVDPLQEQYIYL